MSVTEKLSPIQEFYENSNIFITGVTGFIGKYIAEKLLRSCTRLNKIFILLRPKKGKSVEERLEILLSDPIFNIVLSKIPNVRDKIVVVAGDLSQPNLGISAQDQSVLIESINVVFHSGATVRFDEALPYAVKTNIGGTKNLLLLANQMKNLKSFTYVSTAYSNCNRDLIKEVLYPPGMSCDNLMTLVNILDENLCIQITPTLIQNWPNAYTFTKAVAEDCVRQYGNGMPICIVRPCIVTPTLEEPVPGWVDNINGLNGHCFGFFTGYLRVTLVDKKKKVEVIPVDYLGNFIIAAAWEQANRNDIKVYNYASGKRNPVYGNLIRDESIKNVHDMPTSTAGGYYFQVLVNNIIQYKIATFFLHIIPALIMDFTYKLSGKKQQALKIYQKVHKFMETVAYFCLREWQFEEDNTVALLQKMSPKDKKLFKADVTDIKWKEYITIGFMGIRTFLFKEDPSTIPAAKKRMQKLKIIHYSIVYSIGAILLLIFYKLFSYFLL